MPLYKKLWFLIFLFSAWQVPFEPAPDLNQSMTWAAGLMNIKLKRFVFTRFFPLLISSFWWKSHTKSWQELGNVNQVKPDQILSQAASKHLSPGLRKGGIFASDNLSQVYEAVPGQYNPLNGRSLQCLESDIKCPLPSQCRAYQYPWHGVLSAETPSRCDDGFYEPYQSCQWIFGINNKYQPPVNIEKLIMLHS